MLRAMDSAVAGLYAHQQKLDVTANNLANLNTLGYKSQTFNFQEAQYQTATQSTAASAVQGQTMGGTNAAQYGYGSLMGSIGVDMTESTPTYTGKFDAHICGQGFFITLPTIAELPIQVGDMKTVDFEYTRVGQFKINSEGYIVDAQNNFVYGFQSEDNGGTFDDAVLVPLRVPSDVKFVADDGSSIDPPLISYDNDPGSSMIVTSNSINNAGAITVKVQSEDGTKDGRIVTIGKVAVATFQNPEGLIKGGGYSWKASEGDNSGTVDANVPGGSTPLLMAGYVEGSNVDMSKEFVGMIMAQRGLQANSKIITVSDEILQELVSMKR